MNGIFWTTFFILLAIGFVGTLTVIPYSLALNPEGIETLKAKLAEKKTPLPAWLVILLASGGQGLVLSAVSVFLGLLAADKMGLQLPIFKAIASGQPLTAEMLSFLPIAALFGALSGALLVALEYFFFLKRLPESMTSKVKKLVFWKSALACFYGGFVEEILLRLFVMSGIAWLISLVWKADGAGDDRDLLDRQHSVIAPVWRRASACHRCAHQIDADDPVPRLSVERHRRSGVRMAVHALRIGSRHGCPLQRGHRPAHHRTGTVRQGNQTGIAASLSCSHSWILKQPVGFITRPAVFCRRKLNPAPTIMPSVYVRPGT